MRKRYLWFLLVMMVFCGSVFGATSDPKFLTIGTGTTGGVYYPVGMAMANIISGKVGIPTTAQVTGGAIENNTLVNTKVVDMGIAQTVMSYNAVKGLAPYKEKLNNVSALFSGLSKGVFQVVVNKNSAIKSIRDLKGKKISLGPAGGGAITTFLEVFSAYGYTEKDFQPVYNAYDQAADALVDGNLDAIVVQAAAPTAALTQIIAAKKPVRFISIENDMMQRLLKRYSYYGKEVLTKDVYNTDTPVNTFYIANMLVVRKDLSTDLVYRITKALFENLDTIQKSHPSIKGLTTHSAVEGIPIPLHPGAEKYFKEKGLIK